MTNYNQTLDEVFNILSMHLPIDRRQRLQFITHFVSATTGISNPAPGGPSKGPFNSDQENWFQLVRSDGANFALISVYEFMPPIFFKQIEFDLTPVTLQFEKYFNAQIRARATASRQQQNALNASLESTPNEYFNNINKHKPVTNISTAGLFPEIDYGNFKLAPTIPNKGKASL